MTYRHLIVYLISKLMKYRFLLKPWKNLIFHGQHITKVLHLIVCSFHRMSSQRNRQIMLHIMMFHVLLGRLNMGHISYMKMKMGKRFTNYWITRRLSSIVIMYCSLMIKGRFLVAQRYMNIMFLV
jgi:hypothetical protein